MNYIQRTTQGFTFIELLVVIAIIAILATIVTANLSGANERARDTERITDIAQIQLALEMYYNSCREYPAPSGGALDGTANNGNCTGATFQDFIGSSIPTDHDGSNYDYGTSGAGSDHDDYRLGADLETNDRVLLENASAAHGVAPCTVVDLHYCVAP